MHHSKKFNEIGVGDFTMKCLLCEFETKFFITSKSCPSMLLHAKEVHSNIVGEIESRERNEYCCFSRTKKPYIR